MQFDQLRRRDFITLLGGERGRMAARGARAATGKIAPYLGFSSRSAQVSPNGYDILVGPSYHLLLVEPSWPCLASRDWPQGIGLKGLASTSKSLA